MTNVYGREWRPDPGAVPVFQIPVHLDRTMLGLHLMLEQAQEQGRVTAKTVIGNAIAAIEFMSSQLSNVIDAAERIETVHTSKGDVLLKVLMQSIQD